MNTTIYLPIPSHAQVLVAVGDKITNKTIIAKVSPHAVMQTIHLAKLLSVRNGKISKYLVREIGEKIAAGSILAVRKGFFSETTVKSPINGKLAEIDLSKGTISLCHDTKESDFISPVSGRVVNIDKSLIEIETSEPVFNAVSGGGDEISGILTYLPQDKIGILDTGENIENSVIMYKSANEAVLVKFSVLGALGFITLKAEGRMPLPWVELKNDEFGKLKEFAGEKIWVRPAAKQIVILS